MNRPNRREDLLRAASELFYRDGIRAVGVDTIVGRAEVAKMTLYNHFSSKDELAVEYLRRRDESVWRFIEGRVIELAAEPSKRPLAVFDAFAEQVERDDFRGCHLINAIAELPDRDHPARLFALQQTERWQAYLVELVQGAGVQAAEELADQLFLLLEGAFVAAVMERSAQPMRRARRAAEVLLSVETHRTQTPCDRARRGRGKG